MPYARKHQAAVLNRVLSLWKFADPVEGYVAGFDDCAGKLFNNAAASKAFLRREIKAVTPQLEQIRRRDLREGCRKLFNSMLTVIRYSRPEEEIYTCAFAVWYVVLKGDAKRRFVKPLLEQATRIIIAEYYRWKDKQPFSGETCKAGLDAIGFCQTVLKTLEEKNPQVGGTIKELQKWLVEYRKLFPLPVADPKDLDQLFAYFRTQPSDPLGSRRYQDILNNLFDYGAKASEIYQQSLKALEEELNLINAVIAKLAKPFSIAEGGTLAEVYEKVSEEYPIKDDVVKESKKIMKALDYYIDQYVQDLGRRPNVIPELAPPSLEPLITSGATVVLDYIRNKPTVRIYVVEKRTSSLLSLLNLLVHEAAHAYHPLLLSKERTVPMLAKLRGYLNLPFSEGAAFHRELQLFETIRREATRQWGMRNPGRYLLGIFSPRVSLQDNVNAFELETRVWRLLRAIRTLCDVEVNLGKRSYVDFVEWANWKTGLSKQMIHNECFIFLSYPGYTPSYSFCGKYYEDLESDAMAMKMSRFAFNTKAHKMGVWPWTLCVEKMKAFER